MSDEVQKAEALKPIFWMGGCLKDLRQFPEEVRQVIGFALFQAQDGGKHVDAKPLSGFRGAGVLEIVEDDDGSTFRGIYTVKFPGAIYALDAFQKKSKKGIKTPRQNLDRIRKRLKMAQEHYKKWQASLRSKESKKR